MCSVMLAPIYAFVFIYVDICMGGGMHGGEVKVTRGRSLSLRRRETGNNMAAGSHVISHVMPN